MKTLLQRKKKETGDPAPEFAAAPPKKKRKKIIFFACILVLICALSFGLRACLSAKPGMSAAPAYIITKAEKRDITVSLSGSGTLKPADSYEVTSLVSGEILSDGFEEGDVVEKGAVLYQIDTDDAQTNVRSAELSLEKSRLSYERLLEDLSNLDVTALVSGTVMELDVEPGDKVNMGQKIGKIRNSATMCLTVPFISSDADSFYIGEAATVTLDDTFETLPGTISKISNVEQVLPGGMLVKNVTIDVKNPGAITDATNATAKVGDTACSKSAAFSYKDETDITAEISGEVSYLASKEGEYVREGQLLVKLQSSDLEQQLKSAQLSLEDAQNTLENRLEAMQDYTITSPIAGTIIEKNFKAGDKLDSNSAKTSLCTIYDLSYLTMQLNVDELDIAKVQVGQTVTITADAAGGKTYTGIVTKVNINGTTNNGVTAYPVTIRIDETEGLLPGMNVNAEIVVEDVKNVLSVPVEAVSRGNRVLVQKDPEEAAGGETAAPSTGGIPEGFEYVQVTLGVNNDEYIEITGGLSEGDTIAYLSTGTGGMMVGMYGAGGPGTVTVTTGSEGEPPPPPEGGGQGG